MIHSSVMHARMTRVLWQSGCSAFCRNCPTALHTVSADGTRSEVIVRILVNSFGTRGDIQPFIALAKGLQGRGHEVAISTAEGFRDDVEAQNISFIGMDNELLALSQQILDEQSGGILSKAKIARKMGPAVRRMMDDEWNAAQLFQPDLIVYHPKCLASYHIAEKLNIPMILSLPLPLYTPTRDFAVPFISKNLGGFLNRLTYSLIPLSNAIHVKNVNDFRRNRLSLPPIGSFADLLTRSDGTTVPVLYPISPSVVQMPEDYQEHVYMTGYWFLDQESAWEPTSELTTFLETGPLPIYIGFGSMSALNTKQRTKQIIEAIQTTGQRAIFASGWSDLNLYEFPDEIFAVQSIPHDWLFSRVVAVIHHGGAGTTAAGLRAGKPTLICPFLGDQSFWGKQVHDLAVGPKPIPQREITSENLSKAIMEMMQDSAMQERASLLGRQISDEDGISKAVDIIEAIV